MQFKTLALLFALTAVGAAQDIESDDFPQACQDTCRDAVSLSQHCDDTTEHDDQERDCVCKGKNAESLLNNCAACSKDNGKDKPDSDLAELMSHCGWSYADATSGGSASGGTASATSASTSASSVATTIETTLSSSGASAVSTVTSDGSAVSTASGGGTPIVSTMTTTAAGGGTSSVATALAATPAPYVKIGGLVAGLAVGLPALL